MDKLDQDIVEYIERVINVVQAQGNEGEKLREMGDIREIIRAKRMALLTA